MRRPGVRYAALALALLAAAPAAARDILILRNGEVRGGLLRACAGDRCTLDGRAVPKAEIAWIGLGRTEPSPPAPGRPDREEIHLVDGTIHAGPLVGVSLGSVATVRGSFERAQVAWIYLAPTVPEEEDQPDALGAPREEEPEPPQPPQPPEEEEETPSTPSPDAPPASAPPPPPPTDLVMPERCLRFSRIDSWHGTFRVRFHYETGRCPDPHYHVCKGSWTWTARGSFELGRSEEDPNPFVWEGDGQAELHVDLEETFGYPDWVYIATNKGSGTVRLAGDVFRPRLALTGGCEYGVLFGDMVLPVDERLTRTDTGETQTGRGPARLGVQVTSIPLPESGTTLSGSRRMPVSGEHSGFADFFAPEQGASVFLFTGLWSDASPPSGTVSWSLCPKGVSCGPPPPEGESDDCPEPRNERALLDAGLDQQRALLERLEAAYDRYRQIADQAEQYRPDFEQAARDCKLWEAARVLMSFLIGNYGPSGVGRLGEKVEPGKQFANFLSWLEKVLDGDPSWVLPDAEFKEWFSAEDAYDALKAGWDALGDSSPEALLENLQSCGAPTTDLVYQDAVKYLRLIQEMEPLMDQVDRTLNDLRQKDLELLDLWRKYRDACREYEICRGGDPSRCDSAGPPPEG